MNSDIIKYDLENGKYTYTFDQRTGIQTLYHYGAMARDETGNNFLLALVMRLADSENELLDMKKKYEPETLI